MYVYKCMYDMYMYMYMYHIQGGESPEIFITFHYANMPKHYTLSRSSELVGVSSLQLSWLLLFEIASKFLRRKHGHRCLKVHSYLGSSLLPVCVLSNFVTTGLLF